MTEQLVTPDAPAWVRDAVFYQIFPDRFAGSARVAKPGPLEPWDAPPTNHGFKGGDLLGISEHLDELLDLGITALYLTPIFQSASNHRYHTYDYFHVDPLLGGDAALRELLDEAHRRDIRVVLDGVFNHTGRGFWPFHHVLEVGAASPYRRWFHFDDERLDRGEPIRAYGDPGERASNLGYEAWWDLPAVPKLNTDEPAVRDYLYSVAEHWLRFGIDGWRLDVPGEIRDEAFWRELRRRCRAVNPEAYLVGEVWSIAPDWVGGDRFDGLMNYPLAQAILGFAAGSHLDEAVVRGHQEFGANTRFLDGASFATRLTEVLNAYPEVARTAQLNLLDSHDSPRFVTMAGGDRDSLRLAVLLLATLPGAPCLFYGDEVGVEGGLDPDCRRGYPWGSARQDHELQAFVRSALSIRHREPALRGPGFGVVATGGGGLAFERSDRDRRLVVALNAGETPVELALARGLPAGTALEFLVLPGWLAPPDAAARADGSVVVELPPRSAAIARLP
jgi:neopullulanase